MTWREAHLIVDPGFRRPSFADSGLLLTTSSSAVTTTTYYDTEDLRLARWQCALRRGARNKWSVEVDGREVETFRGGDRPPDSAIAFLTAYHHGAPLVPLATMRVAKRRLIMEGRDGLLLHIDDERTDAAGGHGAALRRLTVSAPPGARRHMTSVVRVLRDAGARTDDGGPAHLLMAAFGVPAPEVAPPRVSSHATVSEAIRGALGASVIRLFRNDGPVRMGEDSEAVHQARVATRRLRSDLRTFKSLLDEQWVDQLRTDLSELADELGRVRDADVLLERLLQDAEQLDDPAAAARVIGALRAARSRDRERLLATMDTRAYAQLLDRLVRAASEPRFVGNEHEPAPQALPPPVRRTWRTLKRSVRSLPEQPSDDQLHAVRIAAKRARYAAEAVAPTVGREAGRFAEGMAELQTHLGDLHDAVVAAGWLRDHARADARDALVVGELIGMQLERAAELRRTWSPVWRAASRKSRRGWMR